MCNTCGCKEAEEFDESGYNLNMTRFSYQEMPHTNWYQGREVVNYTIYFGDEPIFYLNDFSFGYDGERVQRVVDNLNEALQDSIKEVFQRLLWKSQRHDSLDVMLRSESLMGAKALVIPDGDSVPHHILYRLDREGIKYRFIEGDYGAEEFGAESKPTLENLKIALKQRNSANCQCDNPNVQSWKVNGKCHVCNEIKKIQAMIDDYDAEEFGAESWNYYVPDKTQKQYETDIKRFKKIARKYGFKAYFMGDGRVLLPTRMILQAKNTDGEWTDWFTVNLDSGKLRLIGNTDQLNLWFYQTRRDMTPRKLVRFVKEINAFITSVKPHVLVRHLIDPEDYQELKGTPNDAYDDDRYFMGAETFEATKGMDTYAQPLEELKIKPTKTKVGILLASIVAGGLWYSNKMKE